jgi:hypothetical protein
MAKATGDVRVLIGNAWEDMTQVGSGYPPATKGTELQNFIALPFLHTTAPVSSAAGLGHLCTHLVVSLYHSPVDFCIP